MSFSICGCVVVAGKYYAELAPQRSDEFAVQSAHQTPTPRIGGLGVVVATVVLLLLVVPERYAWEAKLFGLSLLPAFAAGFAEDLGWRVSPRWRLLAAACASVLAIALLQRWVPPPGVPGLDALFGFAPFAIGFTVLWATGQCHALNLIDGVNGLAGAMSVLIATGLGLVALRAGATDLASISFLLIPGILRFLVLNWPLGRIFLGDAGAYSLGHALAWISFFVMMSDAAVAPTAVALMFFWPVADTFLAIYRRLWNHQPVGAPDKLHMHQFVMRALLLMSMGRLTKGQANGLTALALLPFIALPIAAAVLLWDRPIAALLAWAAFGALFSVAYVAGLRFFRSGRWRRFSLAPQTGTMRTS